MNANQGRNDGRADALAYRIRSNAIGTGPYARAYLEAYDEALAEIAPANVKRIEPQDPTSPTNPRRPA